MFFIVVKTRELLTKNTLENGGGAGVRKTNNNLRGQPTTETDTETDTARETDPRTETKQLSKRLQNIGLHKTRTDCKKKDSTTSAERRDALSEREMLCKTERLLGDDR